MIMFPPSQLPSSEQFLLITDELAAPADFLLHRILGTRLKDAKRSKIVILSVSEELARWKAIASKSNLNLTSYLASESLHFVDVLAIVQPPCNHASSQQPILRPIVDLVGNILGKSDSEVACMIILDDITSLEWIGFSTIDLIRFSRALYALCRKFNASLICRHHVVSPSEPDNLLRHLLQLCTYHLEVKPLLSGRSGAVSGEIALHPGPYVEESEFQLISRSAAVQYRLTDSGAVFFERGTGGGVL